jgi:hypothetical protein
MRGRLCATLITLLFCLNFGISQDTTTIQTFARKTNIAIAKIDKKIDKKGWLYLKDEAKVVPGFILSNDKSAVGLTERDKFVPLKKAQKRV